MHFSFFKKPNESSMTLKGRHSSLARSRPSMPPYMYKVRRIRSLRKPIDSPASLSDSGALGASGKPEPSQSSMVEREVVAFIGILRWQTVAQTAALACLAGVQARRHCCTDRGERH